MTPDAALEDALDATSQAKHKPMSAVLIDIATAGWTVVKSQEGQTYAVASPPFAVPLRGAGGLRSALYLEGHAQSGRVPSNAALTDALALLEARADAAEVVEVSQRVAQTASGILIDLGRDDRQLVEVTAQGWTTRGGHHDDPLLRRSTTMEPMDLPVRGAGLPRLWAVLNVEPQDRPLLLAFVVCALLPHVAVPILLLKGEQGTGKTTAAKLLMRVIDPGRGQLAGPPRSERDWAVMASGRLLVGLDNLSTITPAQSDMLCRAVTGQDVVARALYSDGDAFVTRVRTGVILTAIDPGAIRGDLGERLLPLELQRFGQDRVAESTLMKDFDSHAGEILGAVLDEVVKVMTHLSGIVAPAAGWPRMADFGQVLAALDLANGTRGLARYVEVLQDVEGDLVAGDPLANEILNLLDDRNGEWKGTSTELGKALVAGEAIRAPDQIRSWLNPMSLSSTLRRLTPALKTAGVEVTFRKINSERLIELRMTNT